MDRKMTPVEKDETERFMQVRTILQHPVIQEMIQFYGRFDYEAELLGRFAGTYMEQCSTRDWLGLLLNLAGRLQGMEYTEAICIFIRILTDGENIGMMGMGMFLQYINTLTDLQIERQIDGIQKVLQIYGKWKDLFVEKVYSEFNRRCELEGQNRIELAAFCRYILEN